MTLKVDSKFITDFDSFKASGSYCNLVVFPMNCESKLSYMLTGFSDLQCGFWSSRSTTDILRVVADRPVTTYLGLLNTSKAFYGVKDAGLAFKPKSIFMSGQAFNLIYSSY